MHPDLARAQALDAAGQPEAALALLRPLAAAETLLRHLAETTADPWIARYRRALLFYADKLDQTW